MTKKSPIATLEITYLPIDILKPDPRNSNTHPEKQIEQLRASIREYGLNKPILLKDDDKTIGAGHGIWEAAKLEGLKQVPTITIRGLSDEKWRAFAIADNRIARNAEWDIEILTAELELLHTLGVNVEQMGFDANELAGLNISGFSLEDRIDRAEITPPLPAKPVVKSGELWLLGDHRVFCGDSTNTDHVSQAIGHHKPLLAVVDPPYGVNYDPTWREKVDNFERHARGKVSNDDRADWTEAWKLFPGDVIYVWHGGLHTSEVQRSLESAGFHMRAQIIWTKQHFVFGRGDFHWQHEPCWYAVRKGGTSHWAGDRKQTTVWEIQNHNPMGGKIDDSTTGHGTQKPIECMRRPILNNSKEGDVVYDAFLGSGTTLICAHMEKRICVGLEISPAYVEVIIERFEKYSGSTAHREDGETLASLRESANGKSRRLGSRKSRRASGGG